MEPKGSYPLPDFDLFDAGLDITSQAEEYQKQGGILPELPNIDTVILGTSPKCDICDKPSIDVVGDVAAIGLSDNDFLLSKPIGRDRRGCKDHPVEMERYVIVPQGVSDKQAMKILLCLV